MKCLNKKVFLSVLLITPISISSCSFFSTFSRLPFKVISSAGVYSFAMCGYYVDPNFTIELDDRKVEEAFKDIEYGIISYDTIKGLKMCQEYGNYKLADTYVAGSHYVLSFDENITSLKDDMKIIANNEYGSLGVTAKFVYEDRYSISYVDSTDFEFYQDLYNGKYVNDYDACIIANPYAQHLIKKFTPENLYFGVIQKLYNSMREKTNELQGYYPECSIFVNEDIINEHKKVYDEFKTLVPKWVKLTIEDPFETYRYLNLECDNYEQQWDKYHFTSYDLTQLIVASSYDTDENYRLNNIKYTVDYTKDDLKKYLNEVNLSFENLDDLLY